MISEKELVAKLLLDIGAPQFNEAKPFVFTSNTLSPVYVDIRKLISYPTERKIVMSLARGVIEQALDGQKIDIVAGGETAGIPYAAWLADEMALPMIYVRKAPKGFGRGSQIEGDLPAGAKVLLVEDLMFDAQSKINFCDAIRRSDAHVEHVLVVFEYGYAASRVNLAKNQITLHALCDWATLLDVGQRRGIYTAAQVDVVRSFIADPKKWGESRRG